MPLKKKKPVPKKKVALKAKPKEVVISTVPPEPKKPKTIATPQTPRGMKDILPADEKYWRFLERCATSLAAAHGFRWIQTPIVEETALFVRGVGKQTDIVEKEMFTFTDQGGESLALRPEGTAPVARAYISHGMLNLPQPVKFWYYGPMFRHERPQGGRQRQFHQFSFETLGDEKPIVDAELVLVAARFFKEIGVPVSIELNSIGDAKCRPPFVEKLVNYYRAHRPALCETCKVRLVKNPLRLLDCKEESCRALRGEAPQFVDHLCDDCKAHFMKVLEFLNDVDLAYTLNPYLVRGLDYYTRTVFEILPENEDAAAKAQAALASGGRYDGLVETLGGRPTPAAGFSIGMERVIGRIKESNAPVPEAIVYRAYFAQLGDPAKKRALAIFDDLRLAGIPILASFTKDALKAQMEIAAGLGVRYVVILGQKEIQEGTVIVRDMDAGVQEIVDQKKLLSDLRKKLGLATPADASLVLPPVKIPEHIPSESAPPPPPRHKPTPVAAELPLDELEEVDAFATKPAEAGEPVSDTELPHEPEDDLGPPAGLIEEEP